MTSGCFSQPLVFITLPTRACSPEINISYFHVLERFCVLVRVPIENVVHTDYSRLHLPGHIFEISLLFLWAKLLQVVRWWMQISQSECEPINQQPHFMRLQPPNCFVSAANYFWEMFLPMEMEPVIVECIAKQKFSCKYIQGRDHILSMPVYTSINHCETIDPKWVWTANGSTMLKFGKQIAFLNVENAIQDIANMWLALLLTHWLLSHRLKEFLSW